MQHWDDILAAIQQELPEQSEIVELLEEIGAPSSPAALGFSTELVRRTFHATKDIRDKYSVSRLLWDIGELDAFFLD